MPAWIKQPAHVDAGERSVGQQPVDQIIGLAMHLHKTLPPGVYGLSNHLLDTPWPKVLRGRERLASALSDGSHPVPAMFEILRDRAFAADAELPRTGLPLEAERALSPLFVVGDRYGTRSSTAILVGDREIEASERTFSPDATLAASRAYRIDRNPAA